MRKLTVTLILTSVLLSSAAPASALIPTRLLHNLESRLLNRSELDWVAEKLAELDDELDRYQVRATNQAELTGVSELRKELLLVKKYYTGLDADPSALEMERLTFALFELETGLEELSRQLDPDTVPLGAPLQPQSAGEPTL